MVLTVQVWLQRGCSADSTTQVDNWLHCVTVVLHVWLPLLLQAPEQTLADALAAISNLRISAHPNLTTTPVFMPKRKLQQQQEAQAAGSKAAKGQQEGKQQQQGKQQQGAAKGKKQQAAGGGGKAAAGKAPVKQQRRQRFDAAASRAAAADSRVQDDSIFGDFEAELLCDELLQKQPAAASAAAARA
jgi:hypothetical protein